MKQKFIDNRSLALIAWMGTLLMLPIQAVDMTIFSSKVSAQQSNPQLSEEQLKRLAQSITVKILSGENTGSGILLKKNNQVYTIITNRHVLESGTSTKIQTKDGKIYPANVVKGVNFQGKDLALLQFRTNVNYDVAPLGNLATVAVNEPIYAAGFPNGNKSPQSQGFVFKTGRVLLVQERAFKEGYQIGYSNEIEKGMSGGPILNRRGQVIGINGIHAYPLWGNPYVYEDGSRPTAALQDLISRYSWGIPIQTLARLAPEYTTKESQPASNIASTPSLPPIANEVNNIAQEITVRIDVPTLRECSGSGVIVGKQGNTYSVLTAEHVVRGSRKCDRSILEVITPDGKPYQVRVNDKNLKTLPETDLAILQFTSNQNYRVATLANYDIVKDQNYIFVSGWLGPQLGGKETQRQFTAGNVASKQLASFLAKNSLSLSYGYGLIYTNLTYKGMSGGPILDIRGRVIGIHGKAELEEITDKAGQPRLISLGFSWGVPISSFVRWSQSVGMASILKVENNQPPKLTPEETKSILEALFKVEKPKDNADAIDWLNYGWELARNTPDKALGENQAKEAFKAIDKAIQLEPNFYQAWYLRGFAKIARQESSEALKSFDKAIQIEPKFAPAWRFRGLTLLGLEKYSEALQSFDQLAKLDPEDTGIQTFRSLILLQAKRFPEALEVSNRIVQNNPGSWAYFARGAARIATGDLQGAMTDLNEAIRLNPEYIEDTAYALRGQLRAQQGNLKGALADFNEAVRFNPENHENFKKRAAIRFQQKDFKEAIADLNEALRLKPGDVEVIRERGAMRFLQQDYKGALADFNEVIRLKPDDAQIFKLRGQAHFLQQDYKAAVVDFNEVLRLKPEDADVLKLRGQIRFLQQEYKVAVADLSGAIRLKPEDTDAYYYRGQARAQIKDFQGAVEDYNEILGSQELGGIGVQIEINAQNKIATVTQVYENSPAQKGGIKTGDQILAVDGQSTANMSLEQVIKLIRGQEGTKVALRINRSGKNTLNTSLTRSQIVVDNKFADVYYHRGLARIQVKDNQGARQDFQKAADLYKQQGKADDYQKVMAKIRELQ
ncbi:serine protease [Anabaena subtropica]|uniref:Tetratricopeptide repeat protein n=1 Tax=Anabaena subtropica FACHB-260 TaxID=2692884 RepID=A0ABR8CJQ6_9NOST|nr:serine protease [Anabaena subtropica]MBD2343471.1 tetratricopeptide repeat protein [Anabaena subtropica FACHB-260]